MLKSLAGAGPYALMLAIVLVILFRVGTKLTNWLQPIVGEMARAHVSLVDALQKNDLEKTSMMKQQNEVLHQLERTSATQTEILREHSNMLSSIDGHLRTRADERSNHKQP